MILRNESKPSAGFTLLEVLIAIVIVGISITSIMMLQKGSALGNTKANRTKMATHIIEQNIENLRIRVLNDTAQLNGMMTSDSSFSQQNGVFGVTIHKRAAILNGNTIANARMFDICVYWKNGINARTDSVRVSTAIAKNF